MNPGGISGLGLRVWGPGEAPLPPGGGTPLPPLVDDRTVYVDSVAGNDANDGLTTATAWRTLQFAWNDRQKYGELRAIYEIRLIGVGPYTMPVMGASTADVSIGRFIIRPNAAPTALLSGTFTGDFAVNTIGTSALGAVDLWADAFVEVTSGNLLGAVFLLTSNTATTLTVANKKARTTAALPIVVGDTFTIWRPSCEISVPAVTTTVYPGIYDWAGGAPGSQSNLNGNATCHKLYELRVTGQLWQISRSCVDLIACHTTNTLVINASAVQSGLLQNATELGVAGNDRLFGAGTIYAGTSLLASSQFGGVWSCLSTFTMATSGGNTIYHSGGRIGGAGVFQIDGASYYIGCVDTMTGWIHWAKTFNVVANSFVTLQGVGACTVTAGSALRISRGAEVRAIAGWNLNGGTTDAAGFGTDCFNGGRCYYSNVAPNLTGGTAGLDIRVNATTGPAAPKANAFFAASGDAIGDPAFGSFVARISST